MQFRSLFRLCIRIFLNTWRPDNSSQIIQTADSNRFQRNLSKLTANFSTPLADTWLKQRNPVAENITVAERNLGNYPAAQNEERRRLFKNSKKVNIRVPSLLFFSVVKMNDSGALNASCFGLKSFAFKPTTAVVVTAIGVSIFNAIFAVTATISNGLMLYILATKPCLKSPSNLLLLSLCVTDFLVGLIVQPLHVVSRIYEIRNIHLCTVKLIYAYFAFLCSGASFLNMMLISMDRCYAVSLPFRYIQKASIKRYKIVIAAMWVSWCCITLLPFIHVISAEQYNKITVAAAGLAIVVIIACYSVIFCVSRKVRRAISFSQTLGTFDNSISSQNHSNHSHHHDRNQYHNHGNNHNDFNNHNQNQKDNTDHKHSHSQNHNHSHNQYHDQYHNHCFNHNHYGNHNYNHNHDHNHNHNVQQKKEKHRSNTMGIVILALFICYTPNLVCILLEAIFGFSLNLAYIAWHWTGLLVFFNSSLNPVIYCVRNRDIRRTLFREIKRRRAETMNS